jgi:thioredoxin
MKNPIFSFVCLATSIFATSRQEDLQIILEKTYLSSQAKPILSMVASQVIEEEKCAVDLDKLLEEFCVVFHQNEWQAALAKPYELLFSDEEMQELRKIHESAVWQKYALQGPAIFSTNLAAMKGMFKDLVRKHISTSSIMGDIWQLSESNIELLNSSKVPVIVEVQAPWCGACRKMEPVFHEVSQEHQGHIQFATMDVDNAPSLAKRFKVRGLPTLLFFKAGQSKPVMRHTGALTKQELEKKIDQFLQKTK